MSRKVLITKMSSQGFGQKIGSELGYSSFEITPMTIEISIDPPIDLATEEGKEAYAKMKDNLRRLTMKSMEEDLEFYRTRNEELNLTLIKKHAIIEKAKENM